MTQKPSITLLSREMAFRYSISMVTHKAPGDQKLFERVCKMLKLKLTKFQLPALNSF